MGVHLSGVKTLPIARDGNLWVAPMAENIRRGRYPHARSLYIYLNKAPDKRLEPMTKAFLQYVLSLQDQALVRQAGYLPLSDQQIKLSRPLTGE